MNMEAWIPIISAALALIVALLKHFEKAKLAKIIGVLVEEVERLPDTLAAHHVEDAAGATSSVKRMIESKALIRGVGDTLSKIVKASTE